MSELRNAAQQEPVAWMQEMPVSGNEERSVRMTTVKMVADAWDNPIPLYTAFTPRRPLTKEQIMSIDVLRYHFALNGGAGPISKKGKEIIGAIEQAHGIGEQHE